jgi:hypothetical protein
VHMRTETRILIGVAFLIFFLINNANAFRVSLSDDAFHYTHNGIDDNLYNEWWYFNGISNDTGFFISYFLNDPENLTGSRRVQASAVLMDNPIVMAIHKSKGYGGDKNNPGFEIDNSGFAAINDSAIHVYGSAEDVFSGATLKWDLIYQAVAAPWYATPVQVNVGNIAGGWMKWLVYMPCAKVSGTITINGQTRIIDSAGYHDHNWGRWMINDPQWNWAQVSKPEDGFWLSYGEVSGAEKKPYLGINFDGKTIKFSSRQINYSYVDFDLDPITERSYPTTYQLKADNGDYQLEVNMSVLKNVPLILNYRKPIPSFVIFEQYSRFTGVLKSKGITNYRFDQNGFSEYATHKLHPIYGNLNISNTRNVTIEAKNERTGQIKTAKPGSFGTFSIDADYADYLENKAAPWIADGDNITLTLKDDSGKKETWTETIDMKLDEQETIG